MLSTVGLGPRTFSSGPFSFTSPPNAPKLPTIEPTTPTKVPTGGKAKKRRRAQTAPEKLEGGKSQSINNAEEKTQLAAKEDITMTEVPSEAEKEPKQKAPKKRGHNQTKKAPEEVEKEDTKIQEKEAPLDKPAALKRVLYQEGDWRCGAEDCRFYNFSKNDSCLKCKSSKTDGIPAEPDDTPYIKEKIALNRPLKRKATEEETTSKPAKKKIPLEQRITYDKKTPPAPRTRNQRKRDRTKLPKNAKITKRPLLHPPIPSPFTSTQKVLYISSRSPFIPQIKRIRTLLTTTQTRHTQPTLTSSKNGKLNPQKIEQAIADASNEAPTNATKKEVILVKAAGVAIPKALRIGMFFQGQEDCDVRIDSGTERAIEDVTILKPADAKDDDIAVMEAGSKNNNVDENMTNEEQENVVDFEQVESGDMEVDKQAGKKVNKRDPVNEIPDARIKKVSTVIVAISLK